MRWGNPPSSRRKRAESIENLLSEWSTAICRLGLDVDVVAPGALRGLLGVVVTRVECLASEVSELLE
jgi:hypothetical protein